jgi:hypothetical protein
MMRCDHPNGKRPLYDARGIFCAYVCDKCQTEVKQKFRPEIFEDSNYSHSEPIEEDY